MNRNLVKSIKIDYTRCVGEFLSRKNKYEI